MAEGVFRDTTAALGMADRVHIDSAGTGSWHASDPPDPRAGQAAAARGIDISGQRARQIAQRDFDDFDLIVAMDAANRTNLQRMAPGHHDKIVLFLDFADGVPETEVPDPYYGGEDGFGHALDLITAAANGLARHIAETSG